MVNPNSYENVEVVLEELKTYIINEIANGQCLGVMVLLIAMRVE